MKVVKNKFIPFGNRFAAINLFGIFFVKERAHISDTLINHESIHTAQMRELLWIPFYVIYLLEWLLRLLQFNGDLYKAYSHISFEKEAYANDSDLNYLKSRRHFAQWRNP